MRTWKIQWLYEVAFGSLNSAVGTLQMVPHQLVSQSVHHDLET